MHTDISGSFSQCSFSKIIFVLVYLLHLLSCQLFILLFFEWLLYRDYNIYSLFIRVYYKLVLFINSWTMARILEYFNSICLSHPCLCPIVIFFKSRHILNITVHYCHFIVTINYVAIISFYLDLLTYSSFLVFFSPSYICMFQLGIVFLLKTFLQLFAVDKVCFCLKIFLFHFKSESYFY